MARLGCWAFCNLTWPRGLCCHPVSIGEGPQLLPGPLTPSMLHLLMHAPPSSPPPTHRGLGTCPLSLMTPHFCLVPCTLLPLSPPPRPLTPHPPTPNAPPSPKCRYLFTEFEDPEFGGRASAVHGAMLSALDGAGPPGKAVCNAIRKQTEVMSQLAYISKELKVCFVLGFCCLRPLRSLNPVPAGFGGERGRADPLACEVCSPW
jgi:hypothetical protein